MKRLIFLLCFLATPAAAHKLRLFATVDGAAVTGYAWFVGGGRAQATDWTAQDAEGAEIAAGQTDAEGRYRFVPPDPVTGAITITADTHEGHVAQAEVGPERFGAPMPPAQPAANPGSVFPAAGPAPAQAEVEAAVQRQVAPLLERIEAMDARMRLTDLLSGLFLIIGLAGIALYIRGRR